MKEEHSVDWDRLPSFGPFSEEEAIARIDQFEKDLEAGKVKWYSSEDMMEYKPASSSEPTARGRRCSKTVKQNNRNYEY